MNHMMSRDKVEYTLINIHNEYTIVMDDDVWYVCKTVA